MMHCPEVCFKPLHVFVSLVPRLPDRFHVAMLKRLGSQGTSLANTMSCNFQHAVCTCGVLPVIILVVARSLDCMRLSMNGWG